MHDTEIKETKAILAAVDTKSYDIQYSMEELVNLCQSVNITVIAETVQNREKVDNALYFGKGFLENIKEKNEVLEADYIIIDDELTANQMRNIEDLTGLSVLDRTTVILDIFAKNATTKEGKIQIELAQYKYRLPRLKGFGVQLSRLGAGVGARGPGETKLETDRRHIDNRVTKLKQQLEEIHKQRQNKSKQREKNNIKTVAIVGYTNVGKSTLLNKLTDANVLEENKLFATLDTTAKKYLLPNNTKIILIDTVGFISRLPHHLVESFKSTLEIAKSADLILNILDATSPYLSEQIEITENILKDIGADNIQKLYTVNKYDLLEDINGLDQKLYQINNFIKISAKTGDGLINLVNEIENKLSDNIVKAKILLPFSNGEILNFLKENSNIVNEIYDENGISIEVLIQDHFFYKIKPFLVDN
ncbi:MAG: GTPase HflX [Oscillospiraceae bacterium]